jgi:AcrR family transcriptional regulator
MAIAGARTQGVGALLPPRATADGTLRRIQEVALTLFAERGYHGVSMRELAAATGVRASSLYAHVESKEDLLLQLVLVAHDEHRDGVRQAVLEAGGDPRDQLRAWVHAHVRMHATYPMMATVANNELHALSDAGQQMVRAVRGDAEGLITDIIDRGRRLGVFRCDDSWLAAASMGAMGIRVASWYRPGSVYTIDQVCDQYGKFGLRIVDSTD